MARGNDNNRKPRLFINHRSEDTGATASRLYVELTHQFETDQVFLDHQRIEGGANWTDRLRREVAQATVMFVLIGDRWLTAQDAETGDRRLNLLEDWVRQEIETALKTETAIVPILVEGASPPSKRALQTVPTIEPLADLQGLPLRRKDWEADFARLVDLLVDLGFPRGSKADVGRRNEPCVELALDRVAPYRTIQAGQRVVYGTDTLSDGTTAFGEGLHIQLTLENHSDMDVVVPLIDVVIDDYDAHPIERFEYPALRTSGIHLEVPGSTREDPVELTALEVTGSSVPVTQGRLFLRAAAGAESQHTLSFSLVARAPGIWRVRVQAEFVDAARSSHPRFVQSDTLCIVKS
ncbi:MAG: toll/interleukin-1 receptor domain-containing protein [Saprospiraceae bacterium]|nr:toll/interleukin-1 receptor domain-containing protein [Pyrinomonadaceae bacterium]